VPPTITAFTVPASGVEASPITLSAAATDPNPAVTLTFLWTITRPDGMILIRPGASVGFTPRDEGDYEVRLTVSDGLGLTASQSATIAVTDVAPAIFIAGADTVKEGATYTLFLGAVTDPGEETVAQYVVHWGDGSSDTYPSANNQTHVYADGPATRAITVDL